jgi:hypothetical protein
MQHSGNHKAQQGKGLGETKRGKDAQHVEAASALAHIFKNKKTKNTKAGARTLQNPDGTR